MTSTPDARVFSCKRTLNSVNNCNNLLRLLQRMMTEFTQFCGARRAAIPENFQFFRATSAEHLRDLDASLEFLLAFERTSDSFKKYNEVLRFAQRMMAVCTQILCPRRAKIWKTFCNFFRAISAHNLRDPNARRARFRTSTHSRHGQKL